MPCNTITVYQTCTQKIQQYRKYMLKDAVSSYRTHIQVESIPQNSINKQNTIKYGRILYEHNEANSKYIKMRSECKHQTKYNKRVQIILKHITKY